MTEAGSESRGILKRDKRGRVRSTPEQRQAVLEQYARSGLSGPEFARVTGICYQTFAWWRHQHKKALLALRSGSRETAAAESTSLRLVEAVMAPSVCAYATPARTVVSGTLHIALPGGVSFELAEVGQVSLAAQLIQALRLPC